MCAPLSTDVPVLLLNQPIELGGGGSEGLLLSRRCFLKGRLKYMGKICSFVHDCMCFPITYHKIAATAVYICTWHKNLACGWVNEPRNLTNYISHRGEYC